MIVIGVVVPAVRVTGTPVIAGAQVTPPNVRVIPLALVLDVPVFWKLAVPVGPAPEARAGRIACTVAELVNDPNRPNTNPATAMAAMRVIAMRMAVARTGEMAFLFLFPMFIVGPC